jgi:circadian clock protein KaiB
MPHRNKRVTETEAFEAAVTRRNDLDRYMLRLFVTGSTPRSARAIQNIRALCDEKLPGRYELEVIDIYQHPEQAKPEQIVVAPTLIKMLPAPVRRVIGDLSNLSRVLVGLDMPPPAAGGNAETPDGAR